MLKKTASVLVIALVLAVNFTSRAETIGTTPQQEGETCTISKTAQLRNARTGNVIATLSRGTKVYILGGGIQGWMEVRVRRGKKTLVGDVNYLQMKCPSN